MKTVSSFLNIGYKNMSPDKVGNINKVVSWVAV